MTENYDYYNNTYGSAGSSISSQQSEIRATNLNEDFNLVSKSKVLE